MPCIQEEARWPAGRVQRELQDEPGGRQQAGARARTTLGLVGHVEELTFPQGTASGIWKMHQTFLIL